MKTKQIDLKKKIFFYYESQWGRVLFWTTFIIWTKTIPQDSLKSCVFHIDMQVCNDTRNDRVLILGWSVLSTEVNLF